MCEVGSVGDTAGVPAKGFEADNAAKGDAQEEAKFFESKFLGGSRK